MLSFQNLNQFVFNLSQVASVVSSASVRVTSNSVKKKPMLDVTCNESFTHSVKIFQQSENVKLFQSLPAVKFGPRLEDIQWIYLKDVNFKSASANSVKNKKYYISIEQNLWENFSIDAERDKVVELKNNKKSGLEQKEILALLEVHVEKSSWSKIYMSRRNFDENKQYCNIGCDKPGYSNRTSSLCNIFIGRINTSMNSHNGISIQKRGFKTKRFIENEKSGGGLMNRLKELETELANNNILATEDKMRMKISFADGYLKASKDFETKSFQAKSFLDKLYTISRVAMAVSFLFFIWLIFLNREASVFPFSWGHRALINPEEIEVSFADVKGAEEVKEELKEIVEFLKNPNKFSNLGGKLPKGILLVGPPGTGKTLLARAVAGEANVPFFHVSGSEFEEVYVGEGARRVRNLFKSAKAQTPCIIFIDEIDAVASKRKTSMLHPYANQTINQLLSEMDGFRKNEGVIVLGATNRKEDLDTALLRPGRFDVQIQVNKPNREERKEILDLYINKITSRGVDIDKLARDTLGFSGADLEAMVNHAAIRAATDGLPYVTMECLENAKDKIQLGPEAKSVVVHEEDLLLTAYHEGGHAVVAHFTEGVGVIDKVTIVPRGSTLGHTLVVPEKETKHYAKSVMLGRIDILMGGRAAEEIIFGPDKITASASNDIEIATDMAKTMVKEYGMSDKIGLRTVESTVKDFISINEHGPAVNDMVDAEVRRIIHESYERAKLILKKHAREHKRIAEALLKYKTLSPEDVKVILGEFNNEKQPPNQASFTN